MERHARFGLGHAELTMPETNIPTVTDPVELALQTLLGRGQERKYITWEEMNEILPDEAINPDKLAWISQQHLMRAPPARVPQGGRPRPGWPRHVRRRCDWRWRCGW